MFWEFLDSLGAYHQDLVSTAGADACEDNLAALVDPAALDSLTISPSLRAAAARVQARVRGQLERRKTSVMLTSRSNMAAAGLQSDDGAERVRHTSAQSRRGYGRHAPICVPSAMTASQAMLGMASASSLSSRSADEPEELMA